MNIEKLETWLVHRWLTVRVTTDDGTQGVGEGTFWGFAGAAENIAHEIGEQLIGKDPANIEHIWNEEFRRYSFPSAAITSAISAIDQALWDIKGKRYGAPVWDLLGGKVRHKVRAMVLLDGGTIDDFVASAKRARADGFTAAKFTPFPRNWSQLPYAELIRQNTAIVAAVRETVGWDFDLGVEIHRNMVPGEAIVFMQQIEKFLPYFVEDPIAPDSVISMGEVAQKIRVPLAAGERNSGIWQFREYVENAGVHFVRPDVGLAGGITQVKKIAAIAESHHQRVIPHNFLGPIVTMSCVQLAAATPNWDLQEYVREAGTPRAEVVKQTAKLVDGHLLIPEAPGLGIEIDEAGMKRHPYQHGPGDTSRRPDGSLALR
ncbi:MAG: mandelate racemase/muconate lactonizing enzyme family protein [Chloroflexi bacterium]|nr:mandelate racemase/muconate lactonizing enzyme family protein [Chloroflexota bacterium]